MTAPSDRNLLFGILALQLDFISRDQLISAMHAWVLAKQQPLGEILREQKALDAARHDLLEALVKQHLALHGNDPQKSLEAVSSLKSVRQELEDLKDPDLHASLKSVAAAGKDEWATLSQSAGVSTSSGTRFRILRPYAKGGLGPIPFSC